MNKQNEKKPSALHVRPGVEAGERNGTAPDAPRRPLLSADEYVGGILGGDRTVLGRAITLIESNAPSHRELAQEVLQRVLPKTGGALRVGISGVPGAGKSTFIETLGIRLCDRGHRVAVTAVDPSSSRSGGSILGDKTRMEKLAADERAFIRPSPSGGALGGVTRKTRETILLFEAAGFDVVLIETVGVGQNEITVREMVDFFLLVLVAGAGDELQGIKKGVIEIADAILVNKASGDNEPAARRAQGSYEMALHYQRPATPGWRTQVFLADSLSGAGVDEMWAVVEKFGEITRASGAYEARRREQERQWLHALVANGLEESFRHQPDIAALLPELERLVMAGEVPAATAAAKLLDVFLKSSD